jgi:hypothetical protein
MTRVLSRSVAGLLALCSSTLVAQRAASDSLPRVPLSVESIETGGRWQMGKSTGYYRAVGFSTGWEEIRHRVFLEWVREPDTRSLDSVIARVELTPLADAFGLVNPHLSKRGQTWRLTVKASAAPLADYNRTVVFEIGPPGKVHPLHAP